MFSVTPGKQSFSACVTQGGEAISFWVKATFYFDIFCNYAYDQN